MKIKDLIISLRPKQWIKNLFVFAALLFVREFNDLEKLKLTLCAFVLFCLASSAVYLMNDLVDFATDQNHPTKKNRPLAAGRISTGSAFAMIAIILAICLPLSFVLGWKFGLVLGGYVFINILYSLWLKKVVIVDVLIISVGFVFRVIAGALAIQVIFSPWLVFCTFFLSLFLGVSKRKNDLIHRATSRYSLNFINQMNMVVMPLMIITYTFYTFSSEHSRLLMLTVPIVLYGLFRYLYILEKKEVVDDGPTDDFYSDRHLQATLLVWVLTILAVLIYKQ